MAMWGVRHVLAADKVTDGWGQHNIECRHAPHWATWHVTRVASRTLQNGDKYQLLMRGGWIRRPDVWIKNTPLFEIFVLRMWSWQWRCAGDIGTGDTLSRDTICQVWRLSPHPYTASWPLIVIFVIENANQQVSFHCIHQVCGLL